MADGFKPYLGDGSRAHMFSAQALKERRRERLGLTAPGAVLHTFTCRREFVDWLTRRDVRELVFMDIAGTGWRLNAGDIADLMAQGFLLPSECDWSQVRARCYSS